MQGVTFWSPFTVDILVESYLCLEDCVNLIQKNIDHSLSFKYVLNTVDYEFDVNFYSGLVLNVYFFIFP